MKSIEEGSRQDAVRIPFEPSPTATAVTLPREPFGINQDLYERLKLLLGLNMRRQILLAVCDDLVLRDRLVRHLESEVAYSRSATGKDSAIDRRHPPHPDDYPRLVTLALDLNDPNPVVQMAQWLTDFPPPSGADPTQSVPAFQITGIEHLTRQPAAVQRLFFSYLDGIERSLPLLEFSVLLWLPRPWFNALKESAPDFWRCRNAVFEFAGDPTPLPHTPPTQERAEDPAPRPPLPPVEPQPHAEVPRSQLSQSELLQILNHDLSRLDHDQRSQRSAPSESATPSSPPDSPSSTTDSAESPAQMRKPQYTIPALALSRTRDLFTNRASSGTNLALLPPRAAAASSLALQPRPAEAPPTAPQKQAQEVEVREELDLETITHPATLKDQIALLHQQQAPAAVLANAYRTLGNLYRTRVEDGIASDEDMLAAIDAYEQVLVWLPEVSPLWIDILNDMGNLYWLLSRRSPSPEQGLANLNQSIQTYQQGLARVQLPAQLPNYTMLQNNLGAAYSDLARFENPAASLQQSIHAYQQALRYRDPDTDPMRYALTQNNLGTAYWNLAQHYQPKESLKQAISAYSEALRYYRPETEPLNHAMIQNNLGTAYWNLAQHERPQDWLTLALGAYRMALRYRTLEKTPAAYAATQNNLGTAYWHMASHCKNNPEARWDYLRQAIIAYAETLVAVECIMQQHRQNGQSTPTLNFDVYATHNNLALAHYQLATDFQIPFQDGDRLDHLDIALREHLHAFQGWQTRSDFRQTTLGCIARTVRSFYNQGGIKAQNLALSKIPGALLPEILPQL